MSFLKSVVLSVLLMISSNFVYANDDKFRSDFRPQFDRVVTAQQLKTLHANSDVLIIDVRLEEDFIKDPYIIPGAQRLNPENLHEWADKIDKSKEVVVYCVAGKWVSQKAAYLLDQSDISVQSLQGGLNAWKQHEGL